MRALSCFLALVLPLLLGAQEPTQTPQTPQPPAPTDLTEADFGRPDVVITVEKRPSGADFVTVTVLRDNYPPDFLPAQAAKIAELAGSSARGLNVSQTNLGTQSVGLQRAEFATDFLVNRESGEINFEALIHPFLGVPEPATVTSFLVQFSGEKASFTTLQKMANDAVKIMGVSMNNPSGLEYRIKVLSQDPKLVRIPRSVTEPVGKTQPVQVQSGPNFIVFLLLGVGVLAAGALVYSLLLRPASGTRRRR